MKQIIPTLCLVVALAAAVTGCQSTRSSSPSSFASVTIGGSSVENIRNVTIAVFERQGYKAASTEPDDLVFERVGSRADQRSFGNWDGKRVWERVKAQIDYQLNGVYQLQCQAYIVRDYGQAAIEDEVRLVNRRSKPYQEMLNAVAELLNGTVK